jgi:hypothetical protein
MHHRGTAGESTIQAQQALCLNRQKARAADRQQASASVCVSTGGLHRAIREVAGMIVYKQMRARTGNRSIDVYILSYMHTRVLRYPAICIKPCQ